jgi:type VI secretion system secreted protein Hcp
MSDIDCYLQFHGTMKGESEDEEFSDAVQVKGWKWGASFTNRGITTAKGGHGDLKNFVFWHYIDSASPGLLQHCEQGMTIPKVTLVVRRQGGKAQKFIDIEFLKVRVLSVDMQSMEAGKLPIEHVTLAFNKVNYQYITQAHSGGNDPKRGIMSFNWIGELLG